jgi:hypothetical protein
MLDCKRQVFAINGELDLTEKNVQQGSPLTQGTDGKYKLAKNTDVVAGLSGNYYLDAINDVNGGEWLANSKMVKVIKIDECLLSFDMIPNATTGVLEKVFPYDETLTYAVGEKISVDANGKLTNANQSVDDDKLVGIVTEAPTATKQYMVITVNKK